MQGRAIQLDQTLCQSRNFPRSSWAGGATMVIQLANQSLAANSYYNFQSRKALECSDCLQEVCLFQRNLQTYSAPNSRPKLHPGNVCSSGAASLPCWIAAYKSIMLYDTRHSSANVLQHALIVSLPLLTIRHGAETLTLYYMGTLSNRLWTQVHRGYQINHRYGVSSATIR